MPAPSRFDLYNANLKKNPAITTEYPKMLTNPTDQSTTVVTDEKEHLKLVGKARFETEPFWGPAKGAKPQFQAETTQVNGTSAQAAPNEVNIPDGAMRDRAQKMQTLDGKVKNVASLVPPQTTFDAALPEASQVVKNPSLGAKPEYRGT